MIRVSGINIPLDGDKKLIAKKAAKKLNIDVNEITVLNIYKESLDARKKQNIHYVYTVDVGLKNEEKVLKKIRNKDVCLTPDMEYKFVDDKNLVVFKNRPVIVGFGPGGMFAALILAQMGHKPLVLERGEDVDTRTKTVEKFWSRGILNTESNVQFGEGGAGTFSDGKLTTRIKDMRCRKVQEELVKAGAPKDIMYKTKPHVGTDLLKGAVKNIRNEIIRLGGEVKFSAKVTDINIENGCIKGVWVNGREFIETDTLILAVGHSARDIFEMLFNKNVNMEQKAFAMGVRIEHPQKLIDISQYGEHEIAEKLGAADYKLTYTTKKGRGVFTFCMCPGGKVVAAASEEGAVAVNGMSYHARAEENANSALLVQVYPEDFGDNNVLSGMYMQRELEKKAFTAGGGNYCAPVQLLGDFMKDRPSTTLGGVNPSYAPGVTPINLSSILPEYITEAIREAIPEMGRKLKGFDMEDAVLTAVESRSSSPVRILRDNINFQSTNIKGLYPVGEGAGYAGGIISAAVDGILAAERAVLNSVENWE